jgi:hypothetical protein
VCMCACVRFAYPEAVAIIAVPDASSCDNVIYCQVLFSAPSLHHPCFFFTFSNT